MKTIKFLLFLLAGFITGCQYVEFEVSEIADEPKDTVTLTEPIRAYATYNIDDTSLDSTYTVLILFAKERLKDVTDTVIYFNGNVSNWEKKIIPANDKNYVIDTYGQPQKVTKDGLYVGARFILKDKGEYNIALVNSGNNWTDLTGSAFIRKDNSGLAWFNFDRGKITPSGN